MKKQTKQQIQKLLEDIAVVCASCAIVVHLNSWLNKRYYGDGNSVQTETPITDTTPDSMACDTITNTIIARDKQRSR